MSDKSLAVSYNGYEVSYLESHSQDNLLHNRYN